MMTEKEIELFLGELDSGAETERKAAIKKVRFSPLDSFKQERAIKTSLGHIEDVNVSISAELGETILKFKEVLKLDIDSVLDLHKSAGDSIVVCINERRTALGEVIIVNDKFAVRINSIIQPNINRRVND